jgi:hypothetical protein
MSNRTMMMNDELQERVSRKSTRISEEHMSSPSSGSKNKPRKKTRWSTQPVTCFKLVFAWLILRLWRWRLHMTTKLRLIFNGLHVIVSQKIGFFTDTAVRISDPALKRKFSWTSSGNMSRESSVCIATGYWLDNRGSSPGEVKIFHFPM